MSKLTTGTCAQGQSPINKGPEMSAKLPTLEASHAYLGEHKKPEHLKKGFVHKGNGITVHPPRQDFGYGSSND